MRVWVDDEGWVALDDAALLAEGGQGRVFAKGRRAYKIASSASSVLDPRKLAALGVITSSCVIRPLASIRAAPGSEPIGHVMARVEGAVPWMQLVPKAARIRLGLDRGAVLQICERLQALVQGMHALDLAVVDLSGGNVLVETRRRIPYLIDVDSAAAPGFAATVITPQIADPLARGKFGAASDWFAFAVLSFELLVGIHPFRGTHPTLHGLEARMAAGVSVLDPAVRLPPVCNEPHALPDALVRWYDATFSGTLRGPAPLGTAALPAARPRRHAGGVGCLARSDGAPIRGVVCDSTPWWWSDVAIGRGNAVLGPTPSDAVGLVRSPTLLGVAMLCHREDGNLSLLIPGSGSATDLGVKVSAIRIDGGNAMIRCGDRLGRLDLHVRQPDGRPWASVRLLDRVSPAGCVLWSGCATARQLGRLRVHALDVTGTTARDLANLDRLHVVDAAAGEGLITLLVEGTHGYDRWVLGMPGPWAEVSWVERDVDPVGCAVIRAPDGAVWVRVAAGLARVRTDGSFGPALDVGAGAVFSGVGGVIRVASDGLWAVRMVGSTTKGHRQSGAAAC